MHERPLLQRIWNAVKPPPAVPSNKPQLSAKQKTIIRASLSVVALVAAGLGVYYWISSAPARAESHFQAGMKLMSPGKYPDAIAEFTTALGISDQLARAY